MHGMQTLDTIHSTADLKRKTMCCASWVLISCCCWVDLFPWSPSTPLPNITMIAMCCASWALIRFHRWVHLFPQEDTLPPPLSKLCQSIWWGDFIIHLESWLGVVPLALHSSQPPSLPCSLFTSRGLIRCCCWVGCCSPRTPCLPLLPLPSPLPSIPVPSRGNSHNHCNMGKG